ncbi:hypothetical protein ACHMW6_04420 [Pseudoduganella sp. UC29_106]|uniref:hypothetical protein n=1 Tax=Pseudoduganella sp. UC29_106 TaxID=3374553 RepID=UPI0037567CB9
MLASVALTAAVAGPKAPRKGHGPAAQAERPGVPRYGMAVYSDLCVNQESGEYGGQRVTLQRFAEVDTVVYEFTAGGLSWPLVAVDVNVDPRGKMIYFTVQPPDEDERTISGEFSPDGETLTLDGGYCQDQSQPMVLAKVKDFGAKAKSCKACPQPKAEPVKPDYKHEAVAPAQG